MKTTAFIPAEMIEQKIFLVRNKKVMLRTHLALLHNAEVRALVQEY